MEQYDLIGVPLMDDGFDVYFASDGYKGMEKLEEVNPDIVLLDLSMPGKDGHEVCREIKQKPRYINLPVIILTASDELREKLTSFEEGADEYLTKEMDPQEKTKRIHAVLRRYQQSLDSNPLSKLPGNHAIQRVIQNRIEQNQPLAVGYCDLDNFKAYNDKYGFMRGDEIILFTANVLQNAVQLYGTDEDFVGHIGGDDFVFISVPERAEAICKAIISEINDKARRFYDEEDAQRGYIIATNRRGRKQKFPLVALSIAVVTNRNRPLNNMAEISKIAGELKKLAKQKPGSHYVFDKRQR